jgi:hypothetical protein
MQQTENATFNKPYQHYLLQTPRTPVNLKLCQIGGCTILQRTM